MFAKYPFKYAEFNGQGEDFKIYPYYALKLLSSNPELQAKMFVYAPRNGNTKTLGVGIMRAKSTMKFMKIPLDALPFEMGGYREDLAFEIWIYPKGVEAPKPTPSADKSFVNPRVRNQKISSKSSL